MVGPGIRRASEIVGGGRVDAAGAMDLIAEHGRIRFIGIAPNKCALIKELHVGDRQWGADKRKSRKRNRRAFEESLAITGAVYEHVHRVRDDEEKICGGVNFLSSRHCAVNDMNIACI